jgi:hypothetical protein
MIAPAIFWSKVQRRLPNECWPWLGDIGNDRFGYRRGYGRIFWTETRGGGRRWKAHRVAYSLVHGAIPKGKLVLHKCDNPQCVNPKHLFIGTQIDNIHDCNSKRRNDAHTMVRVVAEMRAKARAKRTRCKNGHPWKKNVFKNHQGFSACRACCNEASRRYYARKRKCSSS